MHLNDPFKIQYPFIIITITFHSLASLTCDEKKNTFYFKLDEKIMIFFSTAPILVVNHQQKRTVSSCLQPQIDLSDN